MANDIRIVAYGENKASPALKEVMTDSDKAGSSVKELGNDLKSLDTSSTGTSKSVGALGDSFSTVDSKATPALKNVKEHGDKADKSVRDITESTDALDDAGSKATDSLGALGSGFELIGKTNVQDKLSQVALATDFLSGVGTGATLVIDKMKSGFSGLGNVLPKIKEGFSDAGSTAGKVTTGLLAAGIAVAALAATFAVLNAALDGPKISLTETAEGLKQIAASGQITNDSLKGVSSNTGLLDHDIQSLNGTFGQHIKNIGNWSAGLNYYNESSSETHARLKAIDQALSDMVAKGQTEEAAQAFQQLADEGAKSGVSVKELQGGLPKYTEAAKAAAAASQDAASAQTGWKDKLDATTAALGAQDDAIHAVSDTLKASTDPLFAFEDAQDDLIEKQNAMNKAVREHGKNSDAASDATRDYQKSLIAYIGAAANATNGTGHLSDQQRNLLRTAGASKAEVARLDSELHQAWVNANKLDNFDIDIDVIQHFKQTGKYISNSQIENPTRLASGLRTGGVKGAASGATSSGLTWTGEDGPELLDLPPGTSVHTKGDSQRMAMQGAAMSGPIIVQLVVDGRVLAEIMTDPMRDIVNKQYGGVVQNALGSN